MRFAIFDELRCSCGNDRLRLENAVIVRTAHNGSSDAICRKFCEFKHRTMPDPAISRAECEDCRRQKILQGDICCNCGLKWTILDGAPAFSTRGLSTSQPRGLRVIESNPRTDPRWEPFVRAHPRGSPFHHPGWLRALEEEYGQKRLHLACEDTEGRLVAILPLFYTRGLPLNFGGNVTNRRISSLPRTPVAGVLSLDSDATTALLRAAVQCSSENDGVQLQIKTEDPYIGESVEGLSRTEWRPTYQLQLPERPEQIRFGDSSTRHRVKWAANKAIKMGLEVREAENESELRAWYSLYLDVMRRNAVPPRPYRFFRSLWGTLRSPGVMRLWLAERREGLHRTLIAGSIVLNFGGTAFYAFTGGRRQDFSMHPNDLIQWHAIHEACRTGARRYDFGEVAEEHMRLVNFKTKWGAEATPLFRYYSPAPASATLPRRSSPSWIRRVTASGWRRLPLDTTARLGDWIYSYL